MRDTEKNQTEILQMIISLCPAKISKEMIL